MCAATTDDLHLWVEKMMKSLNIDDFKLDLAGNPTKGDGYWGEVTFLKVRTTKNGTKEDYDLVIKSAKKSQELLKQTPLKESYARENLFYSKLFPLMDELQKQKLVQKPFVNIPKCYFVSTEITKEAVILQNLKPLGFELHNIKKLMNLDHVLLVLRNYGRYHALSLALRDQKPGIFKSMTKNLTDLYGQFVKRLNMMDIFYKEFDNVKKLLKEDGHDQALKKFDGFEKQFDKILGNFSNENTAPSVLLHADGWNNNFMFKYQANDRKKPTDMRFLDFQVIRVGSPIIDLSYFLYSCADKQVLQEFDTILEAYHSSACEFLTELGSDPQKLFPFKILREQWEEYGKFGVVVALLMLKVSLCDSCEAPDLSEIAEKGGVLKDCFKVKIQNEDVYNARIKDVYLHFAEKFL